MTDEVIARYDKLRRDLETQLPLQVERIRFSVNRWQDKKAVNEAPIKAQAQRLLEQRAVVAMWEQFPKA
jgi:hypothetical protein